MAGFTLSSSSTTAPSNGSSRALRSVSKWSASALTTITVSSKSSDAEPRLYRLDDAPNTYVASETGCPPTVVAQTYDRATGLLTASVCADATYAVIRGSIVNTDGLVAGSDGRWWLWYIIIPLVAIALIVLLVFLLWWIFVGRPRRLAKDAPAPVVFPPPPVPSRLVRLLSWSPFFVDECR